MRKFEFNVDRFVSTVQMFSIMLRQRCVNARSGFCHHKQLDMSDWFTPLNVELRTEQWSLAWLFPVASRYQINTVFNLFCIISIFLNICLISTPVCVSVSD